MEPHESEYVLDAFNDQVHKYGTAREMLEDADDEELANLVYSMTEDLLELDHDEFVVYSSARGLMFARGYRFEGPELTIVGPDGEEMER